jgi:TetR/AcrR family transcriptional repressor of nem operon
MIDSIWERSYGSASVDGICERAEVGKGSFYHFFKSKTALAIAALDHLWETQSRPDLDEIFSPIRPPLARFERLIGHWYTMSLQVLEEKGRVLGCPYFNLGAEVAAAEPELGTKVREILDRFQGYLEASLHEANARGDISIDDPANTASCLFAMIEGCSTQARIHNDPERVHNFADAFGRMIGASLTPNIAPATAIS